MADQCIVCLENLEVSSPGPSSGAAASLQRPPEEPPPADAAWGVQPTKVNGIATRSGKSSKAINSDDYETVAVIQVCGHTLHDSCLREWTVKANSCPICRQTFHFVNVFDRVGGNLLSSYAVEDKKQVADFDPLAWIDENPEEEEEESRPCPVCNSADSEELLLLCDSCDACYHTYCIGLSGVPSGHWYCMECVDEETASLEERLGENALSLARRPRRSNGRRSAFFPRTRARMRRARQTARSDAWQGAWGQISGRVYDALNLDLDNHEGDEALADYRRAQQVRRMEHREYQRWQQRLTIAERLGAREVFETALPDVRSRGAPVSQELASEQAAWGALQRARESVAESSSAASSRKRKAGDDASSVDSPQEPQRRLKRPLTRRMPSRSDVQSPHAPAPAPAPAATAGGGESSRPPAAAQSPVSNSEPPSFLSALLKEVEASTPSDDEHIRNVESVPRPAPEQSSPATSPSESAFSSPRALSLTPPPVVGQGRPITPLSLGTKVTPLATHITPSYLPANYSPTRAAGESSDSEQRRPRQNGMNGHSEIRQPRPQRQGPVRLSRSQDVSPTRGPLPYEMKQNISAIVRNALKPHWKSSQLTAEQYETINRAVSHKLYDEVADPSTVDDDAKSRWEKVARSEVARAVSDMKA